MLRPRRSAVFCLFALLTCGAAVAQMLDEKPIPAGGDPVGTWEANQTELRAHAASVIVAAFNPVFSGHVDGRLRLGTDGTYDADYAITARVEIASLLLSVDTSFVQAYQDTGTYEIDGSNLILARSSVGQAPAVLDTLGFTAAEDSLFLIQRIPLGGYEPLLIGLFPDAGPPLAVLGLSRADGGMVDPAELTADFDGSGKVDFIDFLSFAPHYGSRAADDGYNARFDLNGNQSIDFLDFLELARQYGKGI